MGRSIIHRIHKYADHIGQFICSNAGDYANQGRGGSADQ